MNPFWLAHICSNGLVKNHHLEMYESFTSTFVPPFVFPEQKSKNQLFPTFDFQKFTWSFCWRLRLSSFVWTGDDWFQECLFGCTVYPIPSMSGIFTYIWLIFMVNVGRYTIHGWYGYVRIPRHVRGPPEFLGAKIKSNFSDVMCFWTMNECGFWWNFDRMHGPMGLW